LIQNNASNKPKKVLVALSGGVDSAVAAAILKKQGHEVAGVFFDFGSWGDASKAKKITKAINIPLKIVDARREFKKKIIDRFVEAYRRGATPNPCVVCNREMKFDLLFEMLQKEHADYVATGHYARIRRKRKIEEDFFNKLVEAKDKTKDQSYFLYRLTRKELAKIIFPLGELKKIEVKKAAKKLGLPVASEESQDICFLADRDIVAFLKKKIKTKPGNVVDEKKNVLGQHEGLPFYTIGQRRRIEVGGLGPYYVVGKKTRRNELVVSNDPKRLLTKRFGVKQANWIDRSIKFPLSAKVQIRYHSPKVSAIIRKTGGERWEVRSEKNLRAVTPGQSAVFYKNGEVFGGGIII